MNALDKQVYYLKLKRILIWKLGESKGLEVWNDASDEYDRIMQTNPGLKRHKDIMAIPSVALYRAFKVHGIKAEEVLARYGTYMGKKLGKAVHTLSSLPGADRI